MAMSYAEVLSYSSQLSQCLDNPNHQIAFENFEKKWNSIQDVNLLFEEDILKNRIISFNINTYNNLLVHNFIMSKAREVFKNKYSDFREKLHLSIFKGAISLNNIENIRKYTPDSINSEECLQMSIKYGSWDAFNYFIEQYIPKKQHTKIIEWSHKEFWAYHHNNYGSTDFFKKLVHHDLSKNKPLKQDIYTMLDNCEFSFIYELIQDKKCFELFRELNAEHYYKLLIKKIKKDEPFYEDGIQLLCASVQCISFDFSQFKLLPKLKKTQPEIAQLIEKFILKDKLDLLPEKTKIKTYKI